MKKNRIRLTESQLHRVINESVKRVLKESKNYGITLTDTLNWVKSKKPNMDPQEQHRFAMNILKKTALSSRNSWGASGVVLNNGDLLTWWDGDNIEGHYGSVGVDQIYLNGKPIGCICHYMPLVITSSVEPYFEIIKEANGLIKEQSQCGLENCGKEYIVDDDYMYYA